MNGAPVPRPVCLENETDRGETGQELFEVGGDPARRAVKCQQLWCTNR